MKCFEVTRFRLRILRFINDVTNKPNPSPIKYVAALLCKVCSQCFSQYLLHVHIAWTSLSVTISNRSQLMASDVSITNNYNLVKKLLLVPSSYELKFTVKLAVTWNLRFWEFLEIVLVRMLRQLYQLLKSLKYSCERLLDDILLLQ